MPEKRLEQDGCTRLVEDEDLVPGNVLRMFSSPTNLNFSPSFSDHIILDVYWKATASGPKVRCEPLADRIARDKYVLLARPYAYVSSAGTTSPVVLTGVEQYEVLAAQITDQWKSYYRVVLRSTGKVDNRVT